MSAKIKSRRSFVSPIEPRLESKWINHHLKFIKKPKKRRTSNILFLGDSISTGWFKEGKKIWNHHIKPMGAEICAFDADRIEHLHWRVKYGELFRYRKPKLIIIHIGTNNMRDKLPEIQVAIEELIHSIKKKASKAKIIILGLFPVQQKPNSPYRKKLKKLHQFIRKSIRNSDDDREVYFLDLTASMTLSDGAVQAGILKDHLHLSEKGYLLWYQEMRNILTLFSI